MTCNEILRIEKCGDLFSADIDKLRQEYRMFAKQFHPDINPDPLSSDTFNHINILYKRAEELLKAGTWEANNLIVIPKYGGGKVQLRFLETFSFELGNCYVLDKHVVYEINKDKQIYFENAVSQIKNIKYANKNMEQEFSYVVPHVEQLFTDTSENNYVVLSKNSNVFPLTRVLNFYNNSLDGKHIAWIISRLINFCCYFNYLGIAHNGLSIENCFICPETHKIVLLGGWWYTKALNTKMIGTSRQIFDIMSVRNKTEKISSILTDIESVKQIGRTLIKSVDVPDAIKNWLDAGSSNDPIAEFEKWGKALDAYGPRKFISMPVNKSTLYK